MKLLSLALTSSKCEGQSVKNHSANAVVVTNKTYCNLIKCTSKKIIGVGYWLTCDERFF